MYDLRKTHVHHKSIREEEVDRLIQFGGGTVSVIAIPLLVSEGTVVFKNFIYHFYRLFQWKIGEGFVENEIDDRLEVHEGICYTLDFSSFDKNKVTDYGIVFLSHCNAFLEDWVVNLMSHDHNLLKKPEYWALKIKLKNGQVGWIYPRGPLVRKEENKYNAFFEFISLEESLSV